MTAAPIDGDLCLVRDLRFPGTPVLVLAKFYAGRRPEFAEWEFFGTDDRARAEDVEIVAHMVAVRTYDVDRVDTDELSIRPEDYSEVERIADRVRRW